MLSLYRAVMDSDYNPLRSLLPAQRFQVMVLLSVMWTTIFCAAAGAWFWYGELIAVHLLFAFGFLAVLVLVLLIVRSRGGRSKRETIRRR